MSMLFKDLTAFNQAKKCLEFLHADNSKLKFKDVTTKHQLKDWFCHSENLRNINPTILESRTVELSNDLDVFSSMLKTKFSEQLIQDYKEELISFTKNPFGYVTVTEVLRASVHEAPTPKDERLSLAGALVRLYFIGKHFLYSNKELTLPALYLIEYNPLKTELENFQSFLESINKFYKTVYKQSFLCINIFTEGTEAFNEFCSFVFPDEK